MQKAHFNAANDYRKTGAKTKITRFQCNKPNFHIKYYELIVSVTGKIDPETGFVMDVKILADIIKEEVENPFDHKNLNLDVPEFKNLNPTAENIVGGYLKKIRKELKMNLT
jgi:6-pyruvoyltetrahydropterin/6-carboxytetrahydropterin synthase